MLGLLICYWLARSARWLIYAPLAGAAFATLSYFGHLDGAVALPAEVAIDGLVCAVIYFAVTFGMTKLRGYLTCRKTA